MPRLSVDGPYEFTDLRVLDPALREVASGTGDLVVDLPPGIYRVEARVPGAVEERFVALLDSDVAVADLDLPFRDSHEWLVRVASPATHVTHTGSATARLSVIVRGDGGSHPGVTLVTMSGEPVARLDHDGFVDPREGTGLLAVALPPGTYGLVHDVPGLGRRTQVVFVEEGWETQVYAPWDASGVDLSRAVISMVRPGEGVNASPSPHLDAALDGLARGRVVLSGTGLRAFLAGDLPDPMLGLIAAYAHLGRAGSPDSAQWTVIAGHLEHLLPHSPDAQLLNLLASGHEPQWTDVEAPPMFARGAELLLAGVDGGRVPATSWIGTLAANRTTGSVWTRWEVTRPPTTAVPPRQPIESIHLQTLLVVLGRLTIARRIRLRGHSARPTIERALDLAETLTVLPDDADAVLSLARDLAADPYRAVGDGIDSRAMAVDLRDEIERVLAAAGPDLAAGLARCRAKAVALAERLFASAVVIGYALVDVLDPPPDAHAVRDAWDRAMDDFTDVDLSGTPLAGVDLEGVRWDRWTRWPPEVATLVEESSVEVAPGVYEVTGPGARMPAYATPGPVGPVPQPQVT